MATEWLITGSRKATTMENCAADQKRDTQWRTMKPPPSNEIGRSASIKKNGTKCLGARSSRETKEMISSMKLRTKYRATLSGWNHASDRGFAPKATGWCMSIYEREGWWQANTGTGR